MATKHHSRIALPDIAAIVFVALPLILWMGEAAQ